MCEASHGNYDPKISVPRAMLPRVKHIVLFFTRRRNGIPSPCSRRGIKEWLPFDELVVASDMKRRPSSDQSGRRHCACLHWHPTPPASPARTEQTTFQKMQMKMNSGEARTVRATKPLNSHRGAAALWSADGCRLMQATRRMVGSKRYFFKDHKKLQVQFETGDYRF